MNAATILLLFNAALTMFETLAPKVQGLFKSGDVSVEEQEALKKRLNALRKSDAFTGPEWEIS